METKIILAIVGVAIVGIALVAVLFMRKKKQEPQNQANAVFMNTPSTPPITSVKNNLISNGVNVSPLPPPPPQVPFTFVSDVAQTLTFKENETMEFFFPNMPLSDVVDINYLDVDGNVIFHISNRFHVRQAIMFNTRTVDGWGAEVQAPGPITDYFGSGENVLTVKNVPGAFNVYVNGKVVISFSKRSTAPVKAVLFKASEFSQLTAVKYM